MIHVSRKLALSRTYLYIYIHTARHGFIVFVKRSEQGVRVPRIVHVENILMPTRIRTRKNTNVVLIRSHTRVEKSYSLDPYWAHRSHDRTITYYVLNIIIIIVIIIHDDFSGWKNLVARNLERGDWNAIIGNVYQYMQTNANEIDTHSTRGFIMSMITYHTKITKQVIYVCAGCAKLGSRLRSSVYGLPCGTLLHSRCVSCVCVREKLTCEVRPAGRERKIREWSIW